MAIESSEDLSAASPNVHRFSLIAFKNMDSVISDRLVERPMDSPTVSVIIPTYNRRDLVQRALESVAAQTYRDFEILVVDDGSTDDTRAVIESRPRVRYMFQENAGPAKARNVGIRHSRGDLIAFLDSDDLWSPEFLSTQVDVLNRYPDVALACARCVVEKRESKYHPTGQEIVVGDLYPELYQQSFIRTPATVVRRSCLKEVGDFNESYRWCEDHDLWLRIAARYPVAYVNRCLVHIGRHGDNSSRDLMRQLDVHLTVALEVLEKNYDRRRIPQVVYRNRVSKRYLQFSRFFFLRADRVKAWSCLTRAVRIAPHSLRAYRYLFKGLFWSLPLRRCI